MTTLNQHLDSYPRGRAYTYAVRVRGLPYLWTDGRTSWDSYAQTQFSTSAVPLLARTDWNLRFESNPLEPLSVGSGVSFELVMDPGGLTQSLFVPTRAPDWELYPEANSIGPEDTLLVVDDATGITQGTKLYWGLETMNVALVDGDTLTVERGYLGSPRRRNQVMNTDAQSNLTEGSNLLIPMDPFTSHPTIWRGRYVDIYMGVLDDAGALEQVWPIWAGRLDSFAYETGTIRVNCDPLTAAITKDSWPEPMPKGSFKSDTLQIFVKQDDLFVQFSASITAGTAMEDGIRYDLGTYDTANPAVFTREVISADGTWMSLQRIARLIQDTAVYGIINTPGTSGTNANALLNNFSVSVLLTGEDDSAYYVLQARNQSPVSVQLQGRGILGRLIEFAVQNLAVDVSGSIWTWNIPIRSTTNFGWFGRGSGYSLARQGQGTLACYMDDRGNPFDEIRGGCYDPTDGMVGYLRLTQGDDVEVISFTDSGISADGVFSTRILRRGLGGTTVKEWGGGVDPVSIEQILVVRVGESMSLADLLLYMLMSSATEATPGPAGNYDYLGEWIGLGVPQDLIDVEGIISRLSISDMPRPSLFWVAESGKGKEAIEELLRMNGVYLVTRRFTRDGVERFGISVDVVDVAAVSTSNTFLADSDVSANKRPRVDINERLLINVISLSPRYRFGADVGDTGGARFARAEDSIRKYGPAKTLEMKPNAIFNTFTSQYAGNYTDPEQITVAIAGAIGLRWFGAYAHGNYSLDTDCPHIGWKFQAGDRVLVNLTGVPNPNGTETFDDVIAKVIDVSHKHGQGAGARISLRLFSSQAAELAPSLCVESVDGDYITLVDTGVQPDAEAISNPWSWTYQRGGPWDPYYVPTARPAGPFFDDTGAGSDAQWFNPTRHTQNNRLRIRLWPRGDYAHMEEFEVLSRSGNVLRLDSAPSATLLEYSLSPTGGYRPVSLLGSFASYDEPSTLRATYAHLGSNDTRSLLGGVDPAKRWV